MPNFETKQEVYDYYDSKAEELAKANEVNAKAIASIFDIFTSGVTYTDENGTLQTTAPLDPNNPKNEIDEQRNQEIMRKGRKTVIECSRPGGAGQLMLWYAKTKGISQNEIIELGSNPSSEKSIATKKKLEGMKQEYIDMINSEDTDKLSDFYLNAFKLFKKECGNIMVNSGKLDSFVKNWPKIVQWTGVTATIQQSFSTGSITGYSPNQKELVKKINAGIEKKFGPGMELRDMITLLQPIHKISNDFAKLIPNKNGYEAYKELDSDEKREKRNLIADSVRIFNAAENFAKKQEINGEPSHYFSKDMAKAMGMASWGYGYDETIPDEAQAALINDDYMQSNSDILLGQMKYLAGDNSCVPAYNMDGILDFTYKDMNDPMDTTLPLYGQAPYCDKTKYNIVLSSEYYISSIVKQKIKENQPLSNEEVVCFLSDANPDYTASMKQQARAFFAMDPSFRMNKLPNDLKAVLTTYCNNQLGLSPEEYLSGVLPVSRSCEQQYKSQLKDISKHLTTETVSSAYNRRMMDIFKNQMKDVSSTIASSKEFVEMEKAFKDLISADPNYPKGREAEYKLKLKALQEKSAKYITAKQADGKKERSTGRGQKRYNIAKRLEAFASESLNQIQKAEEANMLANVPKERKTSFDPKDFNRRVDEMLAPHAKGSKELMTANIYTDKPTNDPDKNTYVPDDINLPENCPFSDHDFAMISYSELANAENFKDGRRYNKELSNDENSMLTYVFSHDDIFMRFRGNTPNDVPLFNKARHSAENIVKEYMKGNSVPLAKSLGNNLKISLANIRTFTTVKENMKMHVIAARKTLDMLAKDPKLMKASGITGKEIKELAVKEAHAKLTDDMELAQKALEDGTEKTPQQVNDLYANIIACKIINEAEALEMSKALASPQALSFTNAFTKLNNEIAAENKKLLDDRNGVITLNDEEKTLIRNEVKKLQNKSDIAYAKVESLNFYRPSSELLERFGDPASYELDRKAFTALIKKHPQFEQLKNSIAAKSMDQKAFKAVMDYSIKNIGPAVDKHNLKKGLEAEKALAQPENNIRIEIEEPVVRNENIPVNGL